MAENEERILIVENDLQIAEKILGHSLTDAGYTVEICPDSANALDAAVKFAPDLMIIEHDLPGLSGKDLLLALQAQAIQAISVMIVEKDAAMDIVQSYRLGVSDVLLKPLREFEVLSTIDQLMNEVRERQAHARLQEQYVESQHQRERLFQELATFYDIGKAIQNRPTENGAFNQIVNDLMQAVEADRGWMLIHDPNTRQFILAACVNMPPSVSKLLNQPWMDELSARATESGEDLLIHGEEMAVFRIAQLGKSAMVIPIKAQEKAIGVLVLMREADDPFTESAHQSISAISDYAAIALYNERLFRALKQRTAEVELVTAQVRHSCRAQLLPLIREAKAEIKKLGGGRRSALNASQRSVVESIDDRIKRMEALLKQYR